MLALQGPTWAEALRPLAATPAAFSLDYFEIAEDMLGGVPCLIARTGYTGEPGVELMCPWDAAPALWDALMAVEAPPAPAGLVARDTLRLEMGYPLYGQELSRERTPIEAGLQVGLRPGRRALLGADVMRRQAEEGTPERLAIFRLTEPGIPRAGQDVLVDGAPAGRVTSGTLSPHARRRHRHGLLPTAGRRARPRHRHRRARASRRPPAPPAAPWWRHPRRSEESRGPPTRATPPTCGTTPSTTGCGPRATRPSSGSPGTPRTPSGEVVYYDPPAVGATVTKDSSYGELESVKAVSDIIAPASGEVVAVNPAVQERPEVVNEDPYGEGWLVRVRLSDPAELDSLMDEPAYRAYLAGCEPTTPPSPTTTCARMLAAIGADVGRRALRRDDPRGRAPGPPARPARRACRSRRSSPTSPSSRPATSAADDEITFLGAGMYDHYVPALIDSILPRSEFLTPVHAVPARDLPGRAAGDVRVPDRDLRADRPAGLERVALRRPLGRRRRRPTWPSSPTGAPRWSSRAASTRTAAGRWRRWRPATGSASWRRRCATGSPTVDGARRPGRARTRPRSIAAAAELPRRGRGPRAARRRRPRTSERSSVCAVRPAAAGAAAPAGRARRRRGRGGGPVAGQPARLRRPLVRVLRRQPRSTSAACPAASPARRATWTAAAAGC